MLNPVIAETIPIAGQQRKNGINGSRPVPQTGSTQVKSRQIKSGYTITKDIPNVMPVAKKNTLPNGYFSLLSKLENLYPEINETKMIMNIGEIERIILKNNDLVSNLISIRANKYMTTGTTMPERILITLTGMYSPVLLIASTSAE